MDRHARINRKHLISVAKDEIPLWRDMPRGLVLVILFAFIHRATTGETFEKTFLKPQIDPIPDYEI